MTSGLTSEPVRERVDALSGSERDALELACRAGEEELQRSGHLFAIDDIRGVTIRMDNGMLSLSDNPLAETRGQLRQLFFIHARDLNEAIQLAAKMSQARAGIVEVRSIIEFDPR
jgi:hypothetical protein